MTAPPDDAASGPTPRPDSIEGFLALARRAFKPEAAGGTQATVQIDFSGQVTGSCHLSIADGKLATATGQAERPDLAIDVDFETWVDILTGKLDGATAFMNGQIKTRGNTFLLMQLGPMFAR
jgi:putative sterol carrier protein